MKQGKFFILGLFSAFLILSAFVMQTGWTVPEKYKTMTNPKAGVKDSEGIGADLWAEHCASCHGKKGAGDGSKSGELETEMEEFSGSEVQKQTDGVIYYKSFIGKGEMPNFEKKIANVDERWFLVNYIRTLSK